MIDSIDHFVLTVSSIESTLSFYERVLDFTREISPNGRAALKFGSQKINLHEAGHEFEPKALHPTPGGADFCLITSMPIDKITKHLSECMVPIELGPVERTGALGPMTSVYFRDPDGNLVEVSRYDDAK